MLNKCRNCLCKTCVLAMFNGGAVGCGDCVECIVNEHNQVNSCNEYYNESNDVVIPVHMESVHVYRNDLYKSGVLILNRDGFEIVDCEEIEKELLDVPNKTVFSGAVFYSNNELKLIIYDILYYKGKDLRELDSFERREQYLEYELLDVLRGNENVFVGGYE